MADAGDNEARRSIVERLDANLFVEAGAGTGKTRALVDRVVALVEAGRDIESIVVITFTEKAAAELRDRIRQALEGRAGEPAAEALTRLDAAPISTIHAFCARVLREFGAVAGVDPGFEIADEIEQELALRDSYRVFLAGPAEPGIARLLSLGMRVADVRSLVEAFAAAPVAAPPPVDARARWPDVAAAAARLASLGAACRDPSDTLMPRLTSLWRIVDELATAPAESRDIALADVAADLEALRFGSGGRKDNWPGPVEGVRAECAAIQQDLQDYLTAVRTEAIAALLPHLVRFGAEEEQRRLAIGRLTYDDLVRLTRNLVLGQPSTIAALRARYATLLIDEFQDTDPQQAEIALAFARNEMGVLEPGRLFVVGDPKQSIYRFRRADMESYAGVRRRMLATGALDVTLRENRRSTAAVIGPVNETFAEVIGATTREGIQPPYVPLEARRPAELVGPSVGVIGGLLADNAAAARTAEAEHIAAHILGVLASGWEVQERDGDLFRTRTATLRDIAILMPTRAGLTTIERALDRSGIPYRVEGGSLLFRTQEIRDLVNTLTAIDDPSDSVAIVGALRSPLFACSDADLAAWVGTGAHIDYLRVPADASGPVAEALTALRGYHHARHEGSLAALTSRIVRERGLAEVDLLDGGSRNGFRRGRYLVEQARAFEASEPRSLRAFVEWLGRRAGAAIVDEEGTALDDDEDAVKLLTIHGAKGLEFPIVFVVGLGTTPRNDLPVLYQQRDGGLVVGVGTKTGGNRFQFGDAEAARTRETAHADAERRRLLYVGATRARDHLVVSLFRGKSQGQGSSAALMEAALRVPSLPEPGVPVDRPAPARFAVDPGWQQSLDRRTAVVAGARRLLTSATALGREREDEAPLEPWTRGRAGTRVGRAVHAAVQSLPWDAAEELVAAAARAQAVAEAIPDRWEEVAALVKAVLDSAAAGRARAVSRALREVPFAMETGGGLLEGFIDLVIESADGVEVVDWKTDAVRPAEVVARLKDYRLQAGLYALALETVTGKLPARITYVFASAGVEASPGEPAALVAHARAVLAGSGASRGS